jgi:VCBS repeat-containing protein
VLGNDSDVDAGSSLTVSNWGTYAGTYGTLTLNQNGTYSYALDNAATAVQALRGGQTVTDAFSYIATDGTASTPGTLAVSVRGTNDAPVTTGDTASVTEDGATAANGNVLGNDTDRDAGTTLQVGNAGTYTGTYGTLTLNQNGSYAYALNNASSAVQGLRTGQSVADAFSYVATDGTASTPGALTISVAGANDAPVVANPIADQTAPIGSAFSFNVAANAFTDADQGDVLCYSARCRRG